MKIAKIEAMPQIMRRKRVAAYARVSRDNDAMRQSLAMQVCYYKDFIRRHMHWEFVGVYSDDPVSGTKDNRPEFQRLVDDCRAGKIDMVITKSVTRFARNTVTTLKTVRMFKTIGVDVYFEKERVHSIDGSSDLILGILAAYAQAESFSASENCKWRIQKKFEQGIANSCTMLGYRLKDGKLQVVPKEAAIVRQIFHDYLSGLGVLAIVKRLIAGGIPTRISGRWQSSTIRGVLTNEKYVGDLLLQKTYKQDHITKKKCINKGELPKHYYKNAHEPIISREMFEQVQQELKVRQAKFAPKKSTSILYPFSRRILCEQCGQNYRRKTTAAGSKYEKIVWICETYNAFGKNACSSQQIPEKILIVKTAEVLGISVFDENVFADTVAEIRVPDHNKLVFVFKDGLRVECDWKNPSRSESWTPEMKQMARKQSLERIRKEVRK